MTTVRAHLEKGPLLFDGATGTLCAARSKNPLQKCELANLTDPDTILDIHRAYISAGAQAIKTNTFGANYASLECTDEELKQVVEAGWTLACRAAGDDIFVFADIGPIPTSAETGVSEQYIALADKFLDLGAEHFLFETFPDFDAILQTVSHIRERKPNAYIIASFAVTPDGFTARGRRGHALVADALASGLIDAAGYNCVSGPGHLQKLMAELQPSSRTLSVMPNAGYPTVVGSRTVYSSGPGYFAEKLSELAAAGVKILGGCCGTDPEFIRETARLLARPAGLEVDTMPTALEKPAATPVPRPAYLEKFDHGEKVIAVELDPPLDSNIETYMTGAKTLKDAGADLITIADCPVARSRMDSSIIAIKLKRELGIDPLPHLTCRDRNLNATKALLLGLDMEGIRQALIVTGDPIPTAERDAVKSVYNFNSRMLAAYIRELGETQLQHPFTIGGALNINARNFDVQLRLAEEKIQNGVSMLLTQPVLSAQGAENLRRAHARLDVRLMGGIMPVVSYRNACYMNSEITGIEVEDAVTQRYRDQPREVCTELAVEISLDFARRISGDVDGYYVITPFSRTDIVGRVLGGLNADD